MNDAACPDRLIDLDLTTASKLLATGDLSPVELTGAYLEQIAAIDGDLNAYVTVDETGAMRQAKTAESELHAGYRRGPLHGIPVGIKDLIDTAGLRTTYGSARYSNHVPEEDAAIVSRVRKAGAVILGKQATHEFAWGGRTDSPHFGPTRNPHDLKRIPGGSSGGGAASVAARSSLLAIGTDTAGSVRIPAALCGCVGLKPTRGWIGLDGVHPLAASLDHIGVMARTVDDLVLSWSTLSARTPTPHEFADPGAQRLRIGWLRGPVEDLLHADVAGAVLDTVDGCRDSGMSVVQLRPPDLTQTMLACLTLVRAEAGLVHRYEFAQSPELYGPDLAELLQMAPVGDDELAAARADATHAADWLDEAMTQVDFLLSATVPIPAPLIGAMEIETGGTVEPIEFILTRLTSMVNASGRPAISVPHGESGGLPIGVQLIGRHGEEGALLAAAAMCELRT